MARQLAPRIPSAADMAAKMLERSAQAGDAWKRGVTTPKKDPIAEAKKAAGKYTAKVQEALANKSYEKGIDKIDEAAMIATIEATPGSAYVDGINRRAVKIGNAYARLQPKLATHVAKIDAMPNATDADRVAKMIANRAGMIAIGKS